MMKGFIVDDNLSNLTSASGEASGSSGNLYNQQSFINATPINQTSAAKKKRSLPGNPDPDAEVISLSPKTLMARNRFVCDVCNKGFQRDQNLQLHRRGHNLPWKLKQRSNKDVIRKKVYVCPELTCVHHDPSRALGDLTGVKKHYSRKHGEKKWKCEKCSKRYAVQSDWKAHSKICGTREYRCDCGTLFSRRDSFITHRAFCDALAEETARSMPYPNPILNPNPNPNPLHIHGFQPMSLKREQRSLDHHNIPPWLDQDLLLNPQHPNPSSSFPPFESAAPPHMSATALLQKAAQMGVTMSKPPAHMGFMDHVDAAASNHSNSLIHDMMNSLASPSGFHGSSYDDPFRGGSDAFRGGGSGGGSGGGGGSGLTRDFLGLRSFSHRDLLNMSGFDQMNPSSSYEQQNQNQNQNQSQNLQTPWQGFSS